MLLKCILIPTVLCATLVSLVQAQTQGVLPANATQALSTGAYVVSNNTIDTATGIATISLTTHPSSVTNPVSNDTAPTLPPPPPTTTTTTGLNQTTTAAQNVSVADGDCSRICMPLISVILPPPPPFVLSDASSLLVPMMPPPPPPPEIVASQDLTILLPIILPPPPPFDLETEEQKSLPPPLMPPPPPLELDEESSKPLLPPLIPPPPPPLELEEESSRSPPPVILPPPPPLPEDLENDTCPSGFIRELDTCSCVELLPNVTQFSPTAATVPITIETTAGTVTATKLSSTTSIDSTSMTTTSPTTANSVQPTSTTLTSSSTGTVTTTKLSSTTSIDSISMTTTNPMTANPIQPTSTTLTSSSTGTVTTTKLSPTTSIDSTSMTTTSPTTTNSVQPTSTTLTSSSTASPTSALTCPPFLAPVGGVCVRSQLFAVSFRFDETFNADLNIPNSDISLNFSAKFSLTLNVVGTAIGFTVVAVSTVTYESGSVIATANAELTNVTDRASTQAAINDAISNNSTIPRELNVIGGTISNFDECSKNTSNDCGNNAVCKNEDGYPGFTCTCETFYNDKNLSNPGRECEYQCTPNGASYCFNGGECFTRLSGPYCTCTRWYNGLRCESLNGGIVAAVVVGSVAGLLLIVLLYFAYVRCIKRRRDSSMKYNDQSDSSSRSSTMEKHRLSEIDEESNLGNANPADDDDMVDAL